MTARTVEEMAKSEVQNYMSERSINFINNDIHALTLIFDNLDDVRSFPKRYSNELGETKIDVLMNSAGRLNKKREMTMMDLRRHFNPIIWEHLF